ncbi:hypothetical protein ACFFMN_06465 [Planobispora siamensis]|uniref:Uncharacterized protein n=1 Tax=Planobispora siamensis TaxID=936338 RepID=A0A8J3SS40_9ACTN|nr:hypothetical protein [Planobispora siamensis]GIH97842.1 hypothetical protein Psi01_84720 [Planobispora siamensis]
MSAAELTVMIMSSPAADGPPEMSRAEIEAIFPDFFDERPLSSQEKEELRALLNAPGGPRGHLTIRQRRARPSLGIIRSPQAVSAVVQDFERTRGSSYDAETYARGVLTGVWWAIGKSETRAGPISGDPAEQWPPDLGDVYHETRVALDLAEGRIRPEMRPPRRYVEGVEDALCWLFALNDYRPVPIQA